MVTTRNHTFCICIRPCLSQHTLDFSALARSLLLNIGIGIRMNILMLDTRNGEQTKMYACTLEEFILVDIWMYCCTS